MGKTIHNEIKNINAKELESVLNILKSNKQSFIVELDGRKICSWEDYITEVQSKFRFPTSCLDSIDRYEDWIRDLDWLDKEEYALVIYNYGNFLKNDSKLKELILSSFKDTILPFWEDEVEHVVVEGKAKSFMVYLVD